MPAVATETAHDRFGEIPVFEEGNSLAWTVYDDQEATVFTDVKNHPDRFNQDTRISMELIIPLGRHGVMICGSLRNRRLQAYQRELSHILATHTKLVFDRIERTEELEENERELEEKNERLGQFASVVSHDLRNPLSIITGYLELAREEPVDEHFDEIETAAERMDALIEDVLSLARSGDRVRELETVDLADVAAEGWSNVSSGSVTLRVGDDVGVLEADRSRLKQLLENLFTNSLEHGGDVSAIRVRWLDGGFAVEDDGTGVPEAARSDVLDFGYSNSENGSGLGLAIVQEIAEGHGWTVDIGESAEGGARFEIRTASSRSE
jgi:signal transduction histidine kinase